jgi:hypothetical protein
LPGVSVETTFSIDRENAPFGFKGSIRTDAVLRNEIGDVIAIYDVKSGGARIELWRARELRTKTGAGPNVPIIEMHVIRGLRLKARFVSV